LACNFFLFRLLSFADRLRRVAHPRLHTRTPRRRPPHRRTFFGHRPPALRPYGARATWHQFSAEKDRSKRDKLLDLLGRERAVVLGGYIHRLNTFARTTPRGRFAQLAVSSLIDAAAPPPKPPLSGLANHTGDPIRVNARPTPL
jgi:hypothetical protein